MKIAVMGYGTIGSGVVEVLEINKDKIAERAGEPIEVKYVLDLREFPGTSIENKIVHDYKTIAQDPEIGIVVETMGGVEPAFTFVKSCLEKGKSVATSNKELVAEKGDILLAIAKEKNCNFFFEASVGGAIPIIRPLHKCLAGNEITAVAGILNGTTNFILTKMYKEKMSFESALQLAQELGYAEKDPTADVEGHDACRKICIISSLVFGKHVYPKSVFTKGISKVDLKDVSIADDMNYSVKLIASVKKQDNGKILPAVMPMLVPFDNIISNVSDVFNAVLVTGDGFDKTMFYGRGAGKFPTASAVLGDVIDCAKHKITVFSQSWESSNDDSFIDSIDNFMAKWYFRVPVSAEVSNIADGEIKNIDDEKVFISTEMSYAEAKKLEAELSASAVMPVLND